MSLSIFDYMISSSDEGSENLLTEEEHDDTESVSLNKYRPLNQLLLDCEELTIWVDEVLKSVGKQLTSDLRQAVTDGILLSVLIEITTSTRLLETINLEPTNQTDLESNIDICLSRMVDLGINVSQLQAPDIASGNLRSVILLISALRHYSNKTATQLFSKSADPNSKGESEMSHRPTTKDSSDLMTRSLQSHPTSDINDRITWLLNDDSSHGINVDSGEQDSVHGNQAPLPLRSYPYNQVRVRPQGESDNPSSPEAMYNGYKKMSSNPRRPPANLTQSEIYRHQPSPPPQTQRALMYQEQPPPNGHSRFFPKNDPINRSAPNLHSTTITTFHGDSSQVAELQFRAQTPPARNSHTLTIKSQNDVNIDNKLNPQAIDTREASPSNPCLHNQSVDEGRRMKQMTSGRSLIPKAFQLIETNSSNETSPTAEHSPTSQQSRETSESWQRRKVNRSPEGGVILPDAQYNSFAPPPNSTPKPKPSNLEARSISPRVSTTPRPTSGAPRSPIDSRRSSMPTIRYQAKIHQMSDSSLAAVGEKVEQNHEVNIEEEEDTDYVDIEEDEIFAVDERVATPPLPLLDNTDNDSVTSAETMPAFKCRRSMSASGKLLTAAANRSCKLRTCDVFLCCRKQTTWSMRTYLSSSLEYETCKHWYRGWIEHLQYQELIRSRSNCPDENPLNTQFTNGVESFQVMMKQQRTRVAAMSDMENLAEKPSETLRSTCAQHPAPTLSSSISDKKEQKGVVKPMVMSTPPQPARRTSVSSQEHRLQTSQHIVGSAQEKAITEDTRSEASTVTQTAEVQPTSRKALSHNPRASRRRSGEHDSGARRKQHRARSSDMMGEKVKKLERLYEDLSLYMGIEEQDGPLQRRHSIMSTTSSQLSYLNHKHRLKKSKSINESKLVAKRFNRLESHMVTLARSIAHMSSELQTQQSVFAELERLTFEVDSLKSSFQKQYAMHHLAPTELGASTHRPPDYMMATEAQNAWNSTQPSNNNRINKLTKSKSWKERFFGQEPPIMKIFLKQLGYEKYLPMFETEKIGVMELPYMTDAKLKSIGIPLGPRTRILQEAINVTQAMNNNANVKTP